MRNRKSKRSIELYKREKIKFLDILKDKNLSNSEYEKYSQLEVMPDRKDLYGFESKLSSSYLTDIERRITHWINGPYRIVLKNKFISYQVLSHLVKTPKVYAVYRSGELHYKSNDFDKVSGVYGSNCSRYLRFLQPRGYDLFIKPVSSGGGKGARSVKVRNGFVLGCGVELSQYLLDVSKEFPSFIVTGKVEQGSFGDVLFPGSVNTVRLLSIRIPSSHKVKVVRGLLRVGTRKTEPVDNFSQGGIAFDLDLNSGKIGLGVSKGINYGRDQIEVHPDTGLRITGRVLPCMKSIVEKAEAMHRSMPYINYVGWDLALGKSGVVLIEANNTTDVDLFQAHQPLLKSKELLEFYRHHNVI